MAIKQIVEVTNTGVPDILTTKCKSVGEIDDKIRQIVADLVDTAHNQRDPGAAGLSANQIGEPVRICLVRRFIGQGSSKDYILINPKITATSSATDIDWEACLSVPDVYGRVKRAKKLTVIAKNEKGEDIKLRASDFFARVIQHELDHLDGILFTSKLVGEPKSEKKNSTKYSLAFLGTSDRSLPILTALHRDFELKLCVTKEDTVVGRKREVRQTAVKKWATEVGVECLTINSVKDADLTNLLNALKERKISAGVIADFGYKIPTEVLSTFYLGLINIHFSLLPKYRGASPVQHAILHNETKTGISFMLTDSGMDTGPILRQISYSMQGNENAFDLYKTLFDLAGQKVSEVVADYFAGKITSIAQNSTDATYCYSPTHPKSTYIYKEDAKIDWTKPLEQISRETRAYYNRPVSWSTLEDLSSANIRITKTGLSSMSDNNLPQFMVKQTLKLADITIKMYPTTFANDLMTINEIQLSGKSKVTWQDFVNGHCVKIE